MTFVRLFKSSIFYNLRLTEIGQFFLFFFFGKLFGANSRNVAGCSACTNVLFRRNRLLEFSSEPW